MKLGNASSALESVMNRTYAFGLLAFLSTLASASTESEKLNSYPTVLDAVKAAADRYNPMSIREDREYMGTVNRAKSGYTFTATPGKRGSDKVSIRIPHVEWSSVVAFWHTHGGADSAHLYFSDLDTEVANRFDKPFYLADYTGFLKVYSPGDRTLSRFVAGRLGLPSLDGFALGSPVKDQFDRTVRVRTRAVESS